MNELAPLTIAYRLLPHGEGLGEPFRASAGAAGYDLIAALDEGRALEIAPGAFEPIPTGLAIALPSGVEAQVRPRSGLALRHGVTILNAPGTIDADYRGEVVALLINHGSRPFLVRRGDRIAQLVIAKALAAQWRSVATLEETERGAMGFGSTGVA